MGKKKASLPRSKPKTSATTTTEQYKHPTAELVLRPDVGTQAQFKKKKPPKTYRYDSSLSPELNWDGSPAREIGEWLLAQIDEAARLPAPHQFPKPRELKGNDDKTLATVAGLADAVEQLKRLSKPFLNWAGKAERLSFDVPTLPLFIHERLSTAAILETLKGHKRDKQLTMFDLFADREHPIHDQVLRAYEHKNGWVNRMILGDSLVVMNSLLNYEGLGGQVQCVYMDPPYGIAYGSNFQPFVRQAKRGLVQHNDDECMTREPEMVKAYRDTWELGLHSYLAFLRDRLLVARELLHPTGSFFLQISEQNVHHARELLDEVFGAENFASLVAYRTRSPLGTKGLAKVCDYLLWYHKQAAVAKQRDLFAPKTIADDHYFDSVELDDGTRRRMTGEERSGRIELPSGAKAYAAQALQSSGRTESCMYEVEFDGRTFFPRGNKSWRTHPEGMEVLKNERRVIGFEKSLRFVQYLDDFPYKEINNMWYDTFGETGKTYAVQTNTDVIERCILMATDPGDLVIDPTCGSGTTAFVAEQWGRRWITMDTSRVPLALARQRLLTATFDYYELKDDSRGPAGGLVYMKADESRNPKSIGPGIVPHVTLESIANQEPPKEEVIVDRPERSRKITRVTGPFCVEGTIPTPVDWDDGNAETPKTTNAETDGDGKFVDRMLEVLRRSPVLQIGGGKSVTLKNVRAPAKTLSLSAEAQSDDKAVAIVFGPENGAISEKLVYEAAREANAKQHAHLFVIGFAIQPNARKLIEDCESVTGIAATYVQATPDLVMGDLLKNMRSSQIFSVCGLPEIALRKASAKSIQAVGGDPKSGTWYEVELLGLDVFDPVTMLPDSRAGNDVPAWFLDTDYNGLCFHVSQAFFPRTGAWDDLKRSLKAEFDPSVWDHLAGAVSAPFEAGKHGEIAVKVIDDRGNELLVVKNLKETM